MILDELRAFKDKLTIYLMLRQRVIRGETLPEKLKNLGVETYDEISVSAGRYGSLIKAYVGLDTINTSEGPENVWDWALSFARDSLVVSALDRCVQATGRTIGKLEEDISAGVRDEHGNLIDRSGAAVDTKSAKVFVAHGGDSEAQRKLCRFLTALGITTLIIEEAPRQSRSVNEQVEYYLGQADCAIVLGTADDEELKNGKLYPRRNVHIEIGRVQERLPDRTIFLLEEGASYPSNIGEKLYTRFTQENMDEAFITVARELGAFGMIVVAKA